MPTKSSLSLLLRKIFDKALRYPLYEEALLRYKSWSPSPFSGFKINSAIALLRDLTRMAASKPTSSLSMIFASLSHLAFV